MPRNFCKKCMGFFSQKVDVCPNCGKVDFELLTPLDVGYSSQELTCFACKFSIKRKGQFLKYIEGDPHQWDMHHSIGQLYCWRRSIWAHRKNGGCEKGFVPLRLFKRRSVEVVIME